MPIDETEQLRMKERELNNGRLAMVAFIGMLYQEYIVGQPVLYLLSIDSNPFEISDIIHSISNTFESIVSVPAYVIDQWARPDFSSPLKP